MAKKEKKVTVKLFLNKDLKPVQYKTQNVDFTLYPLYARIIYNQKSTKFRFQPETWLDENDNIELRPNLQKKVDIIYNILDYELEDQGDKFKIQKFGERLKFYDESVITTYLVHIQNQLSKKINFISPEIAKKVLKLNVFEQIFTMKDKLKTNDFFSHFLFILIDILICEYVSMFDKDITVYEWMLKGRKFSFQSFIKNFKPSKENNLSTKEYFLKRLPSVAIYKLTSKEKEDFFSWFIPINNRFITIFKELENMEQHHSFIDLAMNDSVNKIDNALFFEQQKLYK